MLVFLFLLFVRFRIFFFKDWFVRLSWNENDKKNKIFETIQNANLNVNVP